MKSATPLPLPPVGTGPAVVENYRAYLAAKERDSRISQPRAKPCQRLICFQQWRAYLR